VDEVIANEASRKLVPGWGGRISAALVWDGTDEVRIPAAMGQPRADQMVGTARERLVELSGRVCYDAMGVGRPTAKYFEHILSVGHLSILEHAAMTVEFVMQGSDHYTAARESVLNGIELSSLFLNKPSLYVRRTKTGADEYRVRVTLNPRHVREWEGREGSLTVEQQALWVLLREATQDAAPSILPGVLGSDLVESAARDLGVAAVRLVQPETDEEKWISLYLVGSRGWGNELVRHRFMSAISQRSTRYVEESESDWVLHPLIAQFLQDPDTNHDAFGRSTIHRCRGDYQALVMVLQPWLESKGVDKISARKQARGAARGVLGIGLETEIVYSACVMSWLHVLDMRAADAADAEIRLGFAEAVLPCLRASRYGDRFAHLELVPAGDGIGRSLKGGGHQ
jgi:thymidylate synthase ThyX